MMYRKFDSIHPILLIFQNKSNKEVDYFFFFPKNKVPNFFFCQPLSIPKIIFNTPPTTTYIGGYTV